MKCSGVSVLTVTPCQFPVPPGEIYHILPVGAHAVKPAALTQDAYKLGRSEAAILPPSAKIYICLLMPIIF